MSSHCLQLELSTTGFILASALCLFVTSVPDSEKPISYYLSFIYSLLTFSTWVHTQGRFITVNMDSCEKLFIDYSIVFTYSFLSFALQFPVRTPFPKVGQLLCPLTPFNKVKIYGNQLDSLVPGWDPGSIRIFFSFAHSIICSLWCVFLWIFTNAYIQHPNTIQNTSITLKLPLHGPFVISHSPLATINMFSILIVLHFPEWHMYGITQYLECWVYFHSFRKMHLRGLPWWSTG